MPDHDHAANQEPVLRHALTRILYSFRSAPLPEACRSEAAADAEVIFWPLRGLCCGLAAIAPLAAAFYSPRLDTFYATMLMSFLYWLILSRLNHMRRPAAFCRVCEALADRDHAATIVSCNDRMPVSAGSAARLALLYGGKIVVLYIFCAKYMVMGTVQSTDAATRIRMIYLKYLQLSDSHFMLLLFLLALPVLVEAGAALLYCGDSPGRPHKTPLLLLPAILFAGAVGTPLAIVMGPNALIMPLALIIVMVFYWKKKADHDLGGLSPAVVDAYRETVELAIISGMIILP